MKHLWRHLRYSLRVFTRQPGLTAFAAVAFALGIGCTATMFSITHGLLRGIPFERADRLAYVTRYEPAEARRNLQLTVHEIVDWRPQTSTLEALGGFDDREMDVSGPGERPERIQGALVTANAFDLLRVQPFMGRGFLETEVRPGAGPVAIIGHSLWIRRYAGDPGIIGQAIRVNGTPTTVVGIMPEGFRFPYMQDIWTPLVLDPSSSERGAGRSVHAFGRLLDGVTFDEANAEYASLFRQLEQAYPDAYPQQRVRVIPFKEHIVEKEDARVFLALLVVVGLVLLVACANVANLLLARAATRSQEMAVRTALGASRRTVVGQLLIEALVIAFVGGVLSVGLIQLGITFFNAALADEIPFFWMQVRFDPTVLLFTFALVLAASVIAGIGPALKATGANVNEVLKDASRGASSLRLGRTSRALVVAEVALSYGLLVVAGLMVKGAIKHTESDVRFATQDVFTARVRPRSTEYPKQADLGRFYGELLPQLEGQAGVRKASIVSNLPGHRAWLMRCQLEREAYARDQDIPRTRVAAISDGFFDVLGAGMIEGRGFDAGDDAESQPVAIVNQRYAERFFPGESPLGRRIRIGDLDTERPWRTIVGVAPNLAMNARLERGADGLYIPAAQQPMRTMFILLRAHGDAAALMPAARAGLAAVDPDLPIYQVSTLAAEIERETIAQHTFATLFVSFGAAALFLAGLGLYGVLAFAVRRRTKEIGIRIALGADSGNIVWLTMRSSLVQMIVGFGLGIGIAAMLSPVVRELLFDANPWDWTVYVGIGAALSLTAIAASAAPTARALRVDPMETLRYE
jgi:predicted permease